MSVFRIYVEKKEKYNIKSKQLLEEIQQHLEIKDVEKVRFLERYDMEGLSEETYKKALNTIFSDPQVDDIYEEIDTGDGYVFAESLLSGQYDQQANYCMEYINLIKEDNKMPLVKVARVYVIQGNISKKDFLRIKKYIINPIEKEEVSLAKVDTLELKHNEPKDVAIIDGFIDMTKEELQNYHSQEGLAMSIYDLEYFQNYFIKEGRNPSYTELKVVDTYWSDHCRHTTFMTELSNIEIEESRHSKPVVEALKAYRDARARVYTDKTKPETLMDMATIQVKDLKRENKIPEVVFSAEINACTIEQTIEVDGKEEKWLVLFKNETHNHPTEIEPFGGAGTCLGGAIRDPLSGRAYVYQAMRITGSADPREKVKDTLEGKLPQRVITQTAADGYSSYGNEIGIAAGEIKEYYHEGYKAKRMELGAVVGAVKSDSVIREEPKPGDIVVMIGGRTGRDGCGGATGSSKEQTLDSIMECGSEVQKGDPKEERKLQRLYRNPEFTTKVKRCNDFGAGGVCVAIGELADGIKIDLDKVKLKYPGLDGTEIAISESQERMAIVVDAKHEEAIKELCKNENVEATVVAHITEEKSLVMTWRDKEIVNISREFLDSAGVETKREVFIAKPEILKEEKELNKRNILETLASLNVGLQKGLAAQFDSTIGAGTVLMPYGGKYQLTKEQGMVAKIPVLKGETDAATYMTHGFDPDISSKSPFHGALYAVVESVAKLVALGADYKDAYLSFQEYFERLDEDKEKWGKPAAALLGALTAKQNLGLAAIGGKDSMSGTFNELNVPPTLVSFTCMVGSASNCVSASFKEANHALLYLKVDKDENNIPNFDEMKELYDVVIKAAKEGKIYSAQVIGKGGLVAAVSNMSIGNEIGCEVFDPEILDLGNAFEASYTDIILEVDFEDVEELVDKGLIHVGETNVQNFITIGDVNIYISEIVASMKQPLSNVFKLEKDIDKRDIQNISEDISYSVKDTFKAKTKIEKPRVIVPVFSGTNGEYDMAKAFEDAGAKVDQILFLNQTKEQIEESIDNLVKEIENSQIVALPTGSYKAMSIVLGNEKVKKAIENHTKNNDGLVIGIGAGFQALVKSGILPYGTFTDNGIGRYVSELTTTKITSTNSPWLANVELGQEYVLPISNKSGRFVVDKDVLDDLIKNGQIISQYSDLVCESAGAVSMNPSSSSHNIEGIISKDGRILGKMGHSERIGKDIHKNVPGKKDQGIFKAAVSYYN